MFEEEEEEVKNWVKEYEEALIKEVEENETKKKNKENKTQRTRATNKK